MYSFLYPRNPHRPFHTQTCHEQATQYLKETKAGRHTSTSGMLHLLGQGGKKMGGISVRSHACRSAKGYAEHVFRQFLNSKDSLCSSIHLPTKSQPVIDLPDYSKCAKVMQHPHAACLFPEPQWLDARTHNPASQKNGEGRPPQFIPDGMHLSRATMI